MLFIVFFSILIYGFDLSEYFVERGHKTMADGQHSSIPMRPDENDKHKFSYIHTPNTQIDWTVL